MQGSYFIIQKEKNLRIPETPQDAKPAFARIMGTTFDQAGRSERVQGEAKFWPSRQGDDPVTKPNLSPAEIAKRELVLPETALESIQRKKDYLTGERTNSRRV